MEYDTSGIEEYLLLWLKYSFFVNELYNHELSMQDSMKNYELSMRVSMSNYKCSFIVNKLYNLKKRKKKFTYNNVYKMITKIYMKNNINNN